MSQIQNITSNGRRYIILCKFVSYGKEDIVVKQEYYSY